MSVSKLLCQPVTAPRPPTGPGWLHEIKHDGYRLIARRDGAKLALLTRNGHDWTDRFPSIVEAVMALRCGSCQIDGEAVVCDDAGIASFNLLRTGSRVKPHAFLFAFDLVEIDGRDLRREPIQDRKAKLARLLKRAKAGVQLVEHIEGDGAEIFAHACAHGCEGIVSKRLGSPYRAGACHAWVKVKNPQSVAVWREANEDWGQRGQRARVVSHFE